MRFFRALLRNGLVGVLLAYVLATQAMLAGPLMAAPLTAAHELCLTENGQPAPDHASHALGSCCLAAGHAQPVALDLAPVASIIPMRDMVTAVYQSVAPPQAVAHTLPHPPARGPPFILA